MPTKIVSVPIFVTALLILTLCPVVKGHSGDEIIAEFGTTPTIDGMISVGEWDDANNVAFPATDGNCTVYLKHNSSYLHVAFDIPDNSYNNSDRSWLVIDVEHDGGTVTQTDDIALRVYRDGSIDELHGKGDGTWQSFTPTGWNGATFSVSTRYTNEYSISYFKINITAGVEKTLGIQLIVYNVTGPSIVTSFRWPSGSSYPPDTWGNLTSSETLPWIPEFPASLIFPTLAIATLLATLVVRRKRAMKSRQRTLTVIAMPS